MLELFECLFHFQEMAPISVILITALFSKNVYVFFLYFFSQVPDSSHTLSRRVVECSGGETSTLCRPDA